jgi:hypothetical protein
VKNGTLQYTLKAERRLDFTTDYIAEYGGVLFEILMQFAADQVEVGTASLQHGIGAAVVK